MDRERFDTLTRLLAAKGSRRTALGALVGAGLLGTGLDALAKKKGRGGAKNKRHKGRGRVKSDGAKANGGNSACAKWCHDNFDGKSDGQCTAAAAKGEGPCYECGPASSGGGQLCNGECVSGPCCPGVTTFGNVEATDDGYTLISDLTASEPYGGLDVTLPGGSVDFDDITALQVAYNSQNAPGCRLGSPRFALGTAQGNVFVYFSPNNDCATGPQNTGNLIGNETPGVYDTSQIQPGTQVSTYSATKALLESLGLAIESIDLVVDAGSAGNPQVVAVEGCPTVTFAAEA